MSQSRYFDINVVFTLLLMCVIVGRTLMKGGINETDSVFGMYFDDMVHNFMYCNGCVYIRVDK